MAADTQLEHDEPEPDPIPTLDLDQSGERLLGQVVSTNVCHRLLSA